MVLDGCGNSYVIRELPGMGMNGEWVPWEEIGERAKK